MFFFSNNPIALFLTLVVTIAVLKLFLSKKKQFRGTRAVYILPVLLTAGIFLITYQPPLRMLSIMIPFLALLAIFIFSIGAVFFAMGVKKTSIWPMLKESGIVSTTIKIAVICIIAFAASEVYGDRLLEDQSVSFADAITPTQEDVTIDFSPIFTKQALGLITLLIVVGMGFIFINLC